MMSFTDLACVPADHKAPSTDRLRLAVAAYLARFKGSAAAGCPECRELRVVPYWVAGDWTA